jgi:ABC-2 type transport system ATP-binding protein
VDRIGGRLSRIVEVENLKKCFGSVEALRGLSFQVEKGEIFGIIGPDGAGKTTTLRILSGVMIPDSGRVRVLNYSLPGQREILKEHIGYMPQQFGLYTDLSIRENVNFFADLFEIGKSDLEERLKPLLKMTRLEEFKNRLAGNLSGGMKQKLSLLCTLIHRPEILILDEPTTGVDPVSRREFWEILQDIRAEGVSILLSTPYLDEAEWCSRVGLIFKGSMLSVDNPAGLKKSLKGVMAEVILNEKEEKPEEFFKRFEGVKDVQPFGYKYHLYLESETVFEKLKEEISSWGEIRKIAPSIEDVFVYQVGERHGG